MKKTTCDKRNKELGDILEPQIPKGWKIWRKIEVMPWGSFAIIAENKNKVAIFVFDGVAKLPVNIFNYLKERKKI